MSKQIYDDFFKNNGPDVHLDPIRFTEIAKLCRGAVLDLGCGTGNLTDFYKGDYTGLDISSVAIAYAKELRRKTAQFYYLDVTKEDVFFKSTYDTVVMTEFLEHIEDDEKVFENIRHNLTKNGRIIISVPNGDRVPDETHLRTFTVPELRKRFSQMGAVKFHNWDGFDKRILMTVDLGEKNLELLTLAMICKNEGMGLESAVLSCISFADEIVIGVDKGSTDDTLEIAKRYADVVKEYQWENSFSKARNFVQEGIKNKWVLWLDGHEWVEKSEGLEEALKFECDGILVKNHWENGFTFYFERLIRSYVKWEFDVHNSPKTETHRRLDTFLIKHDRENKQSQESRKIRAKQRDKMIDEIFTKELAENPKNSRASFYLGHQYFASGDIKKAIKMYRQSIKYSKNPEERWLILWQMSCGYNLLFKHFRAWNALRRAEKELPGRWETKFGLGVTWGFIEHYEKMAKYLVESTAKNNRPFLYAPLKYDEAVIFDLLGNAFKSLGKIEEAKIAWQHSYEEELKKPEEEQNKVRLKVLGKYI